MAARAAGNFSSFPTNTSRHWLNPVRPIFFDAWLPILYHTESVYGSNSSTVRTQPDITMALQQCQFISAVAPQLYARLRLSRADTAPLS